MNPLNQRTNKMIQSHLGPSDPYLKNYDKWKTTEPEILQEGDSSEDIKRTEKGYLCDNLGYPLTDPIEDGLYIGTDTDGFYVEWGIHPEYPIGVIHLVLSIQNGKDCEPEVEDAQYLELYFPELDTTLGDCLKIEICELLDAFLNPDAIIDGRIRLFDVIEKKNNLFLLIEELCSRADEGELKSLTRFAANLGE